MKKSRRGRKPDVGDFLARFGPLLVSGGRTVCVVVMVWLGHHDR